jgi:hypothetical protein
MKCCDNVLFKQVARELLGCSEEEDEGFLQWIMQGDKTWVHHYNPENKRQSMEYCHKRLPAPKKFKTEASLEF